MSEQVKPSVTAARAMQILADLAKRSPLRMLSGVCEQQKQISTAKLAEYIEQAGDELAGYAFKLRQHNDALHAEAEALRADNVRLQEAVSAVWALKEKSIKATCLGGGEVDQLRTELEAARGLLEQRIPCDVMLPPATTIKRGCPLSTVLASMKLREDVAPNQRVFTATPAPEVNCNKQLQAAGKPYPRTCAVCGLSKQCLAEQGERQEAIGLIGQSRIVADRFPIWNTEDGSVPAAGTMLYTTPQPGQDVRGLAAFAMELIDGAWEGGSFDGGDIQDAGVRHGLLVVEQREESCGEHCDCAEYGFPAECYRLTPALAAHRQAQNMTPEVEKKRRELFELTYPLPEKCIGG